MNDGGLFVALLRAHLANDESYKSWVPPYTKVRLHADKKWHIEKVGGHVRRAAHAKRSIDALACVCKQPDMTIVGPNEPPFGRKRRR